MTWSTATGLIIVATVVLLILYDLLAYVFGGNGATISKVVLETSQEYTGFVLLFAFAFGVLFGHLFLPQSAPAK